MPATIPDDPVDKLRRRCAKDGVIYPGDWREGPDGSMSPPKAVERRKQIFDDFAALKAHIDALRGGVTGRREAVELVG